jgi:hypothetical protein
MKKTTPDDIAEVEKEVKKTLNKAKQATNSPNIGLNKEAFSAPKK